MSYPQGMHELSVKTWVLILHFESWAYIILEIIIKGEVKGRIRTLDDKAVSKETFMSHLSVPSVSLDCQ